MASLVKIGETVINLDLVTQVYFKPGSVRLYFAVATGKMNDLRLDSAELFGRDAIALRSYLESNSDDLLKLYPDTGE